MESIRKCLWLSFSNSPIITTYCASIIEKNDVNIRQYLQKAKALANKSLAAKSPLHDAKFNVIISQIWSGL